MRRLIVICHGILSDSAAMANLGNGLSSRGHIVRLYDYDWRKTSVLTSGIELATCVVKEEGGKFDGVVLVGHSQGGLVCRIAAAALKDSTGLSHGIDQLTFVDKKYKEDAHAALSRLAQESPQTVTEKLRGVATLGTPNSGAFSFGQLSMLGRAVSRGLAFLGEKSGQAKNMVELTTDRLFRVLQWAVVDDIKYLSASGSSVNRFSLVTVQDFAKIPIVDRLGVHLDLPNDSVVEDVSVDMREAVLPPEIRDVSTQYEHHRLYVNCADVSHKGIHSNEVVIELLSKWISGL